MALMVVTSIAAIFVQELRPGHWSWIHLFIPLTLVGVWRAYTAIRAGNVAAHKKAMLGVYIGGLLIAGSLTFYPGRLMYRIFFGR
jgi:uncharacterized membrane protein